MPGILRGLPISVQPILRETIGGVAAAAWAPNGKVRVAFKFTFSDRRIIDIELIADRKRLAGLGVVLLRAGE
jgi:hypothetical protein